MYKYKPWSKKTNPLTAVKKFIKINKNFIVDNNPYQKALISNCYSGFLKKN
jgi:cephalosporin hydroxylase